MDDGTGREIGFAVAGALAALALVTGTALLIGYSLTQALGGNNMLGRIHYLLVVSALGAGLVIAWQWAARVTAIGGTIALVGVLVTNTPDFSTSLTSLNVSLTVLAVLFVHAASIEYGLRHPAAVRRIVTRRAMRTGIAVGVLHAGFVLAVHVWLGLSTAFFYTLGNTAVWCWTLGGAFLVGAAVGITFARYRLWTPALTVAGLFSWVTYGTYGWILHENGGGTGTLFTLYEWGWYVVLLLALGAGLVEFVLRSRVGRLLTSSTG
ncbi:hypothetical protein [Halococcus agarilyticus]|uniref:hypothetical protein n=1 Tax=Halococcus agarilyticus TaxID=1232219 RepID=UPI000677B8F5|nr:hypothetical protein [Halococcus agarilyticus]